MDIALANLLRLPARWGIASLNKIKKHTKYSMCRADRDGKLIGADAVQFFERSGLPRDLLAKVALLPNLSFFHSFGCVTPAAVSAQSYIFLYLFMTSFLLACWSVSAEMKTLKPLCRRCGRCQTTAGEGTWTNAASPRFGFRPIHPQPQCIPKNWVIIS